MVIVCGLGNPGSKYENTRHNLGFMVVQELSQNLGVTCKLQGKVVQGFTTLMATPAPVATKSVATKAVATEAVATKAVATEPVRTKVGLIRPQTFMNLSGEGVWQIFSYYKLNLAHDATQLIVIQDDLDQPFGRLKIVVGGGAGGHNGISSIHTHLRTKQFVRVKMGIGKGFAASEGRTGNTVSHVLSPFSKDESKVLPDFVDVASASVVEIITRGVASAMNKYNNTTVV